MNWSSHEITSHTTKAISRNIISNNQHPKTTASRNKEHVPRSSETPPIFANSRNALPPHDRSFIGLKSLLILPSDRRSTESIDRYTNTRTRCVESRGH